MSEQAIWAVPGNCNLPHSNLGLGWSVDPEKRLVTVRFGSRLTIDVIKHYAELLRSDTSFEPTFSEIVNLQEIKELDLQAEDFLKLADKVDPFSPEAKRAFVVRSSGQAHAARIHKILRIHRNIQIFHSVDEAQKWIAAAESSPCDAAR